MKYLGDIASLTKQYNTVLADPPWSLCTPGVRRRLHYDRMSTDDICAIPVSSIVGPDAHLWLWTTNPHLPEALAVVRAWGFTYKTLLTWVKPRMGTGWWLRGKTEHLVFAARSTKLRRTPKSITTTLFAPVREHSVKPDEAYSIIETLSPTPRLEIFARHHRDGWDSIIAHVSPIHPFGDRRKA